MRSLVFVHGIANGPADRAQIQPRIEAALVTSGIRDLFTDVSVAEWRSLGDFMGDLIDLREHEVRRQEAVMDVADHIAATRVVHPGPMLVVPHSMGQIVAVMACAALMREHGPPPSDLSIVSAGGPMGNGFARAYFAEWVPDELWWTPPEQSVGAQEWVDVHDPDDPIPGGPAYRAFRAAQAREIPGMGVVDPLHPISSFSREHASYFRSDMFMGIVRDVCSRLVDSATPSV